MKDFTIQLLYIFSKNNLLSVYVMLISNSDISTYIAMPIFNGTV